MVILLFILGLCIGSFINAAVYRIKNDRPISHGRSFCPKCKKQLGWYDLVPVLSYLVLRGKCRNCHKSISPAYPIIELLTGLSFALFYLANVAVFNTPLIAGLYLAIIAVVVFIVLYDFKYYLILDASVFLGIALALPISIIRGSIAVDVISALGLFALFLGMYMFSKGRWLGFGDVKLAIFLGLISGPLVFLTLILSSWMGVLVGLVLFLSRHGKGLKTELPFGTLLGLAAIIVLIGSTYLSDIISQYMF